MRILWRALLIAAFLGVPAYAGELKSVAPTDADSTCIGDPTTPQCALDTWMACDARGERDLCLMVGYWQMLGHDYQFTNEYSNEKTRSSQMKTSPIWGWSQDGS